MIGKISITVQEPVYCESDTLKNNVFDGVLGITTIDNEGESIKKPPILKIRCNALVSLDEEITIKLSEGDETTVFKGGTYEVIIYEGVAIFQTHNDGAWQIPEEDIIFVSQAKKEPTHFYRTRLVHISRSMKKGCFILNKKAF